MVKWKPPIGGGSTALTTLRPIILITPLALVGWGFEAMSPPIPWLRGPLVSVYYGVAGLFAVHLVFTFAQATSKATFFHNHAFDILLLLPLALATDGVRITVGFMALRHIVQIIRFVTPVPGTGHRLSMLRFTPAKVIASSSAGAILVGAVLLTLPLLASYFLAVTPRTAGFNTVDTASLTDLSLFITIILMFVGAPPAGTGGSVKTSTLAMLVLSVRAILRNRDEVEVFYRTILREAVHKALVIITLSFSLINVFTIALLLTDEARLLPTMFEAVSAFGTVGLSMGPTPSLTAAGKLIIIVVMFIGRIGPPNHGSGVGGTPRQSSVRLPHRARDGRIKALQSLCCSLSSALVDLASSSPPR